MYVPRFNVMPDDQVSDFVAAIGSADVVTVGADGVPVATLLPVLWDGDRLDCHIARANPQWRQITNGQQALAIVHGAQAYISPSFYATKAEHGLVVPTWNYSSVHLTGPITVHDDPEWTLDMVARLSDFHEQRREQPWAVSDAPETYIAQQLKAIVGLSIQVERVEAKAKLSQNRSDEDQAGVVRGLNDGSPEEHAVATAMTTSS